MKIKNIENLKERVKSHLKEYLEGNNTVFKGARFQCPNRELHNNDDENPSASFYPGPDMFKCQACSLAGDIFTAAHYIDGKPLSGSEFITDNLLYLADMFQEKYDVADYTPDELKKQELYRALEEACKLSKLAFKSNKEEVNKVKKYVENRGWSELIEDFEFGYCVYDKLIQVLRKKGYSDETLRDVGLLSLKGKEYEKYLFNDRLVFPIRNHYRKVIGFGSRLLEKPKNDYEQKYLQSRNTALYNKTNVLFNMDKARGYAKVYIVEGYADVFTLHKHGIQNVVALCGLSFNEIRYKILVQSGIKQAIFSVDNDLAGNNAIKKIITKDLKNLKGIDIFIKKIPDILKPNGQLIKDPDELIEAEGIEAFKNIPELSVFEWKLNRLKEAKDDEILKGDAIKEIVFEEDYTKKESMCKKLAEVLDVSSEAVTKEVTRHQKEDKGKSITTSDDILEEVKCFERVLNDWDRKIWSRTGNLLGLNCTKFPILAKRMDGIQNMFYIFAGNTNIGKTCFLLNLALDLLDTNENIFVLFFSVDDTVNQLLPRMLALNTDIPINTLANPKYKIKYNDELTEQEKERMLLERAECIDKLKNLAERFALKEESEAKRIEQLDRYIRIYKKLAGDKQLVVFVDNLHRISSEEKMSVRELYMMISDRLKFWKTSLDIPVITTAEIIKTYEARRPRGDDIKECVTGDTLIEDAGTGKLYRIDELKEVSNMLIWSINKNLKLEKAKISKWLSKGKKKIIKLITSSGREIRGSANHPILTDRGWIYLKNLKKSDMIAIVRHKAIRGKKHEPKLARFLGYMAGDGHYKSALFSNKDIGVRKDIITIVKNKFGITPSFQKNGDIRLLNRRSKKRIENPVKKFFRELGLINQMKTSKIVPKIIFEMDNESIANFLTGYFIADGTLVKNRFIFYSCSLNLLKGTQSLLLRFGIQSNIVGPYKYNKNSFPMFQLHLSGNAAQKRFSDIIIPIGKKAKRGKKIKLRNGINNFDRLPLRFSEKVEKMRIKKGLDRKFMGCFYMQKKKNGDFYCMRRDTAQKISKILDDDELTDYANSDIHWDTIKKIEKEHEQEVFDIQVEKNHNFVTSEGLVVHNTKDLQFDADVVGLLYNDFYKDPNTILKFSADEDMGELPIVELNIDKNKTSDFKSTLYYKFYPEFSKYVECSLEEMRELRRQIQGRS